MADLYVKDYTNTKGAPVARLLFIHGFGEHTNLYPEFFEFLNQRNIEVFSFDQRGFGRSKQSPKLQGCTGGWKKQLPDIDYHVQRASDTDLPLFLMGHSMGGGLSLQYGISGAHRKNLKGVVAQAPMLQSHPDTKPNYLVYKSLSAVSRIMPNFTWNTKIMETKKGTRDQGMMDRILSDPLTSSVGSLETLRDLINCAQQTLDEANRFHLPLLIAHGTDDNINLYDASQEFYEHVGTKDKTFLSLPDCQHSLNIEQEPDRTLYLNQVCDWIHKHASFGNPTPTTSAPSATIASDMKSTA
ncbi:mitochondrial acylglycerol lipase Mgl1 [Schizosaccharomyces osmophilus]|uniref:Mitochondrial acylglycerol lipase Mgl1 n=1 Tax=Schizosaccharomyces osmophilus TaxID=2545709 RepID=A0AAE9WEL7_9SCHI|nr:mitochondrial acylglycerol lipase Mgl1 [Schizosaccharomyces osmophilus]WBW74864.1 mitochondrial acylglycerol lipase Mgl1 [Schizosaccharomyces osmophilus]